LTVVVLKRADLRGSESVSSVTAEDGGARA
jgi:hypothetical protein